MPDSTPPVVEPVTDPVNEPVTDPVTPKPADPPTPPPADLEPADDVPGWGKDLMAKVDSIAEQIAAPVEEVIDPHADSSPVRPPWHKRSFLGW